jgi:GntR family transcriptional regulator/MocR family aminotransferase
VQLHLPLDPALPLVRQLIEALRAAILERRLLPGERLPATRLLARQLGVSRNSVLAAYEQLTAEGYLAGRVGAGSFVQALAAPSAGLATGAADTASLSAYGERVAALAPRLRKQRRPQRFDLVYGSPPVAPALHAAWRRALAQAADDTAFDYPPVNGLPALREALAQYLARRRGLVADPGDILIVAGIQQGIDLVARVLLDPGDRVITEDPCYHGLRDAFAAHGARVTSLPVDDQGIDCSQLPAAGARLIAVTPSHQFPTGAVLSLPRRLALLEYAARHASFVLEDDYDGEYRHRGHPLAALRSLDRDGRVLYVGSFSRIVFPALRLGYIVMPLALRPALQAARWLADRGSAAIDQRALASLIAGGQLERQLLRNARRLDEQREVLLAALAEHLGARIAISGGDAGMHLCVRLLDLPASAEPALVAAAARLDAGVYGARDYYQAPPKHAQLLLGYAHLSPQDLKEAVARLAVAVAEVRGG